MPKIIPLKANELVEKLKKLGFEGPFPGGRHMFMIRGSQKIPFPQHGGKDISRGGIQCILRQIQISVDERNKL